MWDESLKAEKIINFLSHTSLEPKVISFIVTVGFFDIKEECNFTEWVHGWSL